MCQATRGLFRLGHVFCSKFFVVSGPAGPVFSEWRVRCLRHDPHGLGTGFGVVWVVLTTSGRVIKGSKFPQGTA